MSDLGKLFVSSNIPSVINCNQDPIVVLGGCRSAIGKSGRGNFKDIFPDKLLAPILSEAVARSKISKDDVADIVVGNVLSPGCATLTRIAAFEAGFNESVSVMSVNRQCASGLEAIAVVAGHISCGDYNVGIAAGVESMSKNSFEGANPTLHPETLKSKTTIQDCTIPMGVTSDNLAKKYNISRKDQDYFAYCSHLKAIAAQNNSVFDEEITVVENISQDEGPRRSTSMEALGSLKSAFLPKGTTTAGNASPLSDGASAVVLSRLSFAQAQDLPIMAIWRSYAVVGVPPGEMGTGPAFAIPEACLRAGIPVQNIDLFEINEAFASQVLYCVRSLRIPLEKVNIGGGALALGHPLGCSGNRLVVTMMYHLRRCNLQYGVVSLCVGTGMGAAAVLENPHYDSTRNRPLISRL